MKKNNPVYFWPSWFLTSFNKEERAKISPAVLKNLNQGQIYLWDALNIYDDILDGTTKAQKLSAANNYFRRYLEIYYRLKLPNNFYNFFNYLIDDLGRANLKEYNQEKLKIKEDLIIYPAKLPEFSDLKLLARKSLALSSGPLALLYLINSPKSLAKIPGLINFFRYTLAAKQLSDDSRDWLEDLKDGSITYPNSLIIKIAEKNKLKLNLKRKPEIIYLLFVKIAPKIGRDIKSLCQKARREAKNINLSEQNPLILNIIKPLEKAVSKAQKFNKLLKKT